MNDLIEKLAEHAGCQRHKYWDPKHPDLEGFIFSQAALDKFAELIVKRIIDNVECHASLFNTKEARQVCSCIVNSVKYDFGVSK